MLSSSTPRMLKMKLRVNYLRRPNSLEFSINLIERPASVYDDILDGLASLS